MSSVVGALFFTVLMIAGFSVLSLALDAQTDIVTTQRIVSDIEIKKQQEQFGVFASTDANDFLNISINNQGQNPVEISSMWITNKTLPDQPAKRYTINYDDAFVPSGFVSNVIPPQTLAMTPDKYDIKIVSSFGSIKTVELDTVGGGSSGLRVEMIADPPDPVIGKNVTIAMIVTNTGDIPVTNVQPGALSASTNGMGSIVTSPPIPSGPIATLTGGASVMFTWDTQVTGDSGDVLSYSSHATGDLVGPSNTASDTSLLRLAGEGGGTIDPDIVNDDLLARPQLFFVIPSPQGDSGDHEALWGINVVNPIDAQMEVSKLVITAFAPGANSNDKIFHLQGASNCINEVQMIAPTTGWSCPSDNMIMWQNQGAPIIIPENSTTAFLVKIDPGKPAAGSSVESVIVQSSVFTTLGSFGKAGYQSAMSGDPMSIANVYMSDVVNSRANGDIKTTRTGILPNSLETFNIVFADMDTCPSCGGTTIADTSRLIINVPKGWTDVQVLTSTGFVAPTITPFGDTSTQIDAQLTGPIGDGITDARTITFEARAPDVLSDQLYVMYVLAQGTTLTPPGFSVGPTAEIVLQVDNG